METRFADVRTSDPLTKTRIRRKGAADGQRSRVSVRRKGEKLKKLKKLMGPTSNA